MNTERIYREIAIERREFTEYEWLTPKQVDLATAMSYISEDHMCAVWLSGLEYELWGMAFCGKCRDMGFGIVDEDWLQVLRELSDETGGWIFWVRSDDVDQSGCHFVPRDEWERRYAEAVAS